MLLDDLAQLWGHAGGLPGLRLGMAPSEALAALPPDLRTSSMGGDLHFVVGDPLRTEGVVALHVVLTRWREIKLAARARGDGDGSFWSGASLVSEFLADELALPKPKARVGQSGQRQIRLRGRGVADGAPCEVQLFAEGVTEGGTMMEVSLLPERSWSDLVGDALGVGPALSSVLAGETPIPAGGTVSLPAELHGSHVEVLHAVDGSFRVRVAEGPRFSAGPLLASSAVNDAEELLRRLSAKQSEVKGLAHACAAFHGLRGATEVRLARIPGVEGELVIVAA